MGHVYISCWGSGHQGLIHLGGEQKEIQDHEGSWQWPECCPIVNLEADWVESNCDLAVEDDKGQTGLHLENLTI